MTDSNNNAPSGPEPETAPAPVVECISNEDMLTLERTGNAKQLAQMNAARAAAESETADLQYKNVVLQLFIKYGLSSDDNISTNGTLTRNKK